MTDFVKGLSEVKQNKRKVPECVKVTFGRDVLDLVTGLFYKLYEKLSRIGVSQYLWMRLLCLA